MRRTAQYVSQKLAYLRAQRLPRGTGNPYVQVAREWIAAARHGLSRSLHIRAAVLGSDGELRINNFIAPQYYHRLTVRSGKGRWNEKVPGEPTYTYQLRAFVAAVQDGGPVLTPPADSVQTMSVIDDIYRAAGLAPRGQ